MISAKHLPAMRREAQASAHLWTCGGGVGAEGTVGVEGAKGAVGEAVEAVWEHVEGGAGAAVEDMWGEEGGGVGAVMKTGGEGAEGGVGVAVEDVGGRVAGAAGRVLPAFRVALHLQLPLQGGVPVVLYGVVCPRTKRTELDGCHHKINHSLENIWRVWLWAKKQCVQYFGPNLKECCFSCHNSR